MFKRKRAMTSEAASTKKKTGHINERLFAELIEGFVISGQKKTDVRDQQGNCYSIKGAEWWQIFMYARNRFVTNTEFLEIGNVAGFIINCLDAFPETRQGYESDKMTAKHKLQSAMRELKDELCKPGMFPEFLSKGMFNGDEVDYLAALEKKFSGKDVPIDRKHFHVFSATDVVDVLSTKLVVENSTRRGQGQMDALKVIFLYRDRKTHKDKNAGEFEIRVDASHYRKARWRFNSDAIIGILTENIEESCIVNKQISVYGSAIHDLPKQV